ncbi:MAG: hypothetical protein CSA81_13140 [Acidobacteria bacterium]|nr:MAG: hypothetical protein CSA81_13140 [Acidobacteriota bacterium]PIE89162.1 MAG: hypothetical protein CR997_12875 [Acidobacteriota bacterium]
MTRELSFTDQTLSEITQEINSELGNKPYKIIQKEGEIQVIIPENEDPLDLFTDEIDALDDMVVDYLEALGIEGEIGYDILGQTIWINIDSEEAGCFLKNRGELLNDLQHVLEVYLNQKFPDVKVYVKCDADAQRRTHIDDMLELAQQKSKQALEKDREMKLPPMNAYERRVIHLSLLPVEGISTRSHGMGALKQVVITPIKTEDPKAEEES